MKQYTITVYYSLQQVIHPQQALNNHDEQQQLKLQHTIHNVTLGVSVQQPPALSLAQR